MPEPRARVGLLLAVLLVLALVPSAVPPASAALGPADEAITRVVVDDVAPLRPEPGGRVTVVGRVAEGAAVTDLRLAVGAPVTTRSGLREADRSPRYRARLDPVPLGPRTAADGTRPFVLSVPVEDLGLDRPGVYPVGVEALVGDVVFARTDTVVPWFGEDLPPRLGLGVLLPFVTPPLLQPGGSLPDDAEARLERELAPTGRLGRLLAAAAPSAALGPAPVTWAVDADLLRTVEVAATTDGPARDVAAAWLETARQAAPERPVLALPYADADLAALLRDGQPALAEEAVATGAAGVQRLLGVAPAPGATWPAPGGLRTQAARTLVDGGTSTLVLGDDVVAGDQDPVGARAHDDDSGADVLVADQGLARLAVPTARAVIGGAAVPRQRLLAETALLALQQPEGGRDVVLALPRDWDPSPAWAGVVLRLSERVPWLRPADPLPVRTPEVSSPEVALVPGGDVEPLGRRWTAAVAGLAETLSRLDRIVLPEDAAVLAPERRSVLRATSAAWRPPDEPARGEALLAATATHLQARLDAVRLAGPRQVTLTSDAGDLPVTVVNDLPARVEVTVEIDAGGQARLAVDRAPRLVLAPESSQTVAVPVRAGTSGRFRVEVQLRTAAGEPVGEPSEVLVRVTALGRLALAITVAAVAVLLLASGVRLLRRGIRAARRPSDGAPAPGEPDPSRAGTQA